MILKFRGEVSAIQVVVAIVVLLIVALALLSVSTGAVSDLGSKVKSVISYVFGGGSSGDSDGAIDEIMRESTRGYG